MTSPIPTIQVLLDDGTGTYPTDITSSVRTVEGITSSRGRADEQSDNQPGALTLTLDNTAGLLTPSGFGTGTFGGFGFGGGPSLDRGIRVKIAGLTRYTGRLQSLPVSWPTGGEEFAVVTVTATDALATCQRRTLRGAADEEILADAPAAYYPAQEPSEATACSDLSGNNQPALTPLAAFPATAVFGAAIGTPDGATGVKLTCVAGLANARLRSDPASTWSDTSVRVNFLIDLAPGGIAPADTAQIFKITNTLGTQTLTLSGLGVLTLVGHGSGVVPLLATQPHVIGLNINSTASDIWVDGVKVSTAAGIAATWNNTTLVIGDDTSGVGLPVASVITVGRFCIGPHISDARMLSEQLAMVQDMVGETPTARAARLCGYAGVPTGTLDATGATTLGYAAQSGRSALDCLLEVAQADAGNVFADKNGNVTYISGRTTAGKATPDAALDANWVGEDTSVIYDMTAVANDITGTTAVTENSYRITDPTSITAHGVYPVTYSWNLADDTQVQARTVWQLSNYAEPAARVGQLSLDLLTMDSTARTAALALDLGAYLRATGMPLQTTGGTQLDVIVEGVAEMLQIGPGGNAWTLTLNVVQRSLVGAWVLGDTTWGVLDSTTKLAIG